MDKSLLLIFFSVLGPLLLGILIYTILFFILRRLVKNEAASQAIRYASKPTFFLILELAAFFSLVNADLELEITAVLTHVLIILFLVTLGFTIINIVKGIYRYYRSLYQTPALEDFSTRSFLTQLLILYRTALFVIFVITIAAIFMTFPGIRSFGIGILGSAGIAGIALGIAARPILLNLIAGFQIAFTKLIKIGDVVVIAGEQGRIEQISLTHVILRLWDLRRNVVPISEFIDKPFENWSSLSTELIGHAFLYCDYKTNIPLLRNQFLTVLQGSSLWNKKVGQLDLVDLQENTMKIRLTMSVENPTDGFNLQCLVREKLVEFLQKEYHLAFPRIRYVVEEEK